MRRLWLPLVLLIALGVCPARAEEPSSSNEAKAESKAGGKNGEKEEEGSPWAMFGIQVFGFLLLVWVLKKYAGPGIHKGLEERRDKFASAYDKIKKDTEEVERLVREFNEKLANMQQESKARLDKHLAEAQTLRADMQAEGKAIIEEIEAKAKREIDLETGIALAEVRLEVVERAVAAAREALARGVSPDVQRQLVAAAVQELSSLSEVSLP